ncbi:glycosyltransferase family 2 protein, partial [Patescibacteria group bacterium]|nr:glycosyltransferase family 2 protein [Patescibacteria group bacterium]
MQQSSSNILSIIIVSYNTKQLLKECLNSINDQNHNKEVEIIVVDNASSDETVKMVKEYFPEIKLIENDKNMGFGVANNQGAAIARGEYLLLINSDTALEKNALNKMIAAAEKYEDAGAIGFKIMNSDRSLQSSCGNFPTLWNIIAEALFLDRIFKPKSSYHILNEKKYQNKFNPDWVSGSCFMIKKKVFDKVSGFD